MPVPEVVTALTEGKPIQYPFTVVEGENVFQVAESLEAKGLATKAEFLALQQEDAASPIVAVKDADKIESGTDEPVYAHDKIADEFCS